MSLCPHCRVFSGAPTCSVCKTYFRVGAVLQESKLHVYQEAAALTALRNCAGALSDLVEVTSSGPFGPKTAAEGEAKGKELGSSPLKEEPEPKEEAKKDKKDKPAEKEKPATGKKEKRRGKKKDKATKPKSPSRSREERSPEVGDARKRKREERLEATGSTRAHREDLERRPAPRSPREPERNRRREESREEDSGRGPSAREVERDPSRFGLDHIPIRGSAGKKREDEVIPAGHRRPAEPDRPPPRGAITATEIEGTRGTAALDQLQKGGKGIVIIPEESVFGRTKKEGGSNASKGKSRWEGQGSWESESKRCRSAQSKGKGERISEATGAGQASPEKTWIRKGVEKAQGERKTLWESGHTVRGYDLCLDWLKESKEIVIEDCRYFLRESKLAGEVLGTSLSDGRVILKVRPTGTTDEAILKLQSGTPQLELRLLLCKHDCNHEETAEDLVHCIRLRRKRSKGEEEPWTDNLEKVAPPAPGDELQALRERMEGQNVGGAALPQEKKEKDSKKKKRKRSKERDKSVKRSKSRKRSKKKATSSAQSVSSGNIALDGSKPKLASLKSPRRLFEGTGLDPSERVRGKVMRRAQKYVKKKGRKNSSDSGSSSGASSSALPDTEEDSIFQQAARVRGLAESYPGVLSHQAMRQMRTHLLQGWGEEEKGKGLPVVAVQYFRQVLQKRATGPMARELLTLCAIADSLAKGRPAQAMDVTFQRIKSAEASLSGMHWSVAQKLEVLPQENTVLTDTAEMREAQKIAQEEQKMRWLASQPDGKGQSGLKGPGKSKGAGKEDRRGDPRKGGKGGNSKGDKRKDEAGAKAS